VGVLMCGCVGRKLCVNCTRKCPPFFFFERETDSGLFPGRVWSHICTKLHVSTSQKGCVCVCVRERERAIERGKVIESERDGGGGEGGGGGGGRNQTSIAKISSDVGSLNACGFYVCRST